MTRFFLDRLKRYGPTLHCVVTLTEDLAIQQATRADEEIAAGNYRGPLHGIPYGVKDLLAVPEYSSTRMVCAIAIKGISDRFPAQARRLKIAARTPGKQPADARTRFPADDDFMPGDIYDIRSEVSGVLHAAPHIPHSQI